MKRLLCLLFVCLLLGGCAAEPQPVQEHHFAMDTIMDLKVWAEDTADAEDAIRRLKGLINELNRDWSATDENSVLSAMNRGEAVALTDEQQALFAQINDLVQRTGGAFDPRLGNVSAVWGFYDQEHRVPSQQEVLGAMAQPRWDLGAAMKGYLGKQAEVLLAGLNVDRALLNFGGNVQTFGEKPDGAPWNIAIQNPDGGDSIGIVSVEGSCAVVTSGDYQRYFVADGVRYHHIIDPKTGYPADSGLRSVTVICRDGLTADALSTALFVMGLEDGITLWRQSNDFEAVFILSDGSIYATQGANLSGCEFEVITREN